MAGNKMFFLKVNSVSLSITEESVDWHRNLSELIRSQVFSQTRNLKI